MSSFLRPLAYRHRWIYDTVTHISSLMVGGKFKLRTLGLEALRCKLLPEKNLLDLCCGSGEAAAPFFKEGFNVTGLDISNSALNLGSLKYPGINFIEGLAESPPFAGESFAAIQLSLALHEFSRVDREKVLSSSFTLLKPGGWIVIVDLHKAGIMMSIPQKIFCYLFENETAHEMIEDDLLKQLDDIGFIGINQELLAGKAVQLITAQKSK